MKNLRLLGNWYMELIIVSVFCNLTFSDFKPYAVNSWDTPEWAQDKLAEAGITKYRDFVIWGHCEPADVVAGSTNTYNWWTPDCGARIAKRMGAKIMYTITDVPDWANISRIGKQAHIQKACEFVEDLLDHIDSIAPPDTLEAIDWGNEMYVWGNCLDQDPSWYHGDLMKAIYTVVKTHNPNIKVTQAGPVFPNHIGEGIIDQYYQLGLKGYFDRTNIHYYVHDMGPQRDPMYQGIYHYPTVIKYMRYLSEINGDYKALVCNTEYGWILDLNTPYLTENQKSDYFRSVLEVSRKSAFSDAPYMYPGHSTGYPDSYHSSALIYSADWSSSTVVYTTSYYMYKDYSAQYPTWGSKDYSPLQTLTPASADIIMTNPGFEEGTMNGWSGGTIDSSVKHSGNYSAKCNVFGSIQSKSYTVEPNRLYEIIAWIKVDSDIGGAVTCMGVPDTRNYPGGGWMRKRYKYLTSSNQTSLTLNFDATMNWTSDIYIVIIKTAGTISNLNRNYEIVSQLTGGQNLYTNVAGTFSTEPDAIPTELKNLPWIRPIGTDRSISFGTNFLNFDLSQSATVYLACQYAPGERLSTLFEGLTGIDRPEWMQSWTNTGMKIKVVGYQNANWIYKVYSKTFSAGKVILGGASGSRGNVWIDDVQIKALNIPEPTISNDSPLIGIYPQVLDFGELGETEIKELSFNISNAGIGTLSGTISCDMEGIEIDPVSFNSNETVVKVKADNSQITTKGQLTGTIYITSNGGNATVTVTMNALCVLVKPNPYNPEKGPLTFFGSGIVPGQTTIKIYTLSGEPVKTIFDAYSSLETKTKKGIQWDGKTDEGKLVVSGIYLYTYDSPKEKGVGKFTVIK